MAEHTCRICGNTQGHRELTVREMQFGLRESFLYFLCPDCGCAQIDRAPDDLSPYYPRNYYSLSANFDQPRGLLPKLFFGGIHRLAPLVRQLLLSRNSIGRLPRTLASRWDLRLIVLEMVSRTGINRHSSILDVGCGNGFIPYCLKQAGLSRVVGIDPFVERDLTYRNGLQVLQADLEKFRDSTRERFDLVMFHHSLEHMERHDAMLSAAADLLSPQGVVLVRIPLVDGKSFDHYQEHLVSLDAPRHLIIHSRRSFEMTAVRNGFHVDQVFYDSNAQQFWGSEQYLRDIPLLSDESYYRNRRRSLFSARQMRDFARSAARLNREGRGDAAGFILRPHFVASATSSPSPLTQVAPCN